VHQRSITWFVIFVLALGSLFGASGSGAAQGGSGAVSGLPKGIGIQELAAGEVDASATAPGTLTLERVTLPAGAGLASRQVAAADVLYVEHGTLTLVDSLGLTSTLTEEQGAHLRAGAIYETRNDGSEAVSILRLSLTGTVASATPVVSPMATPVVGNGTDDVVVTSLAEFSLATIPASPATLFLDRATWESGVDSGPYTQTGPIGVLVESGTLTISSPSGIDGELSEGNAVLLPADQELRTRNDGDGDAVALLFGVIPSGSEAMAAVPPTPTPEPTPSPTPEPTATTVPSPTPEPTAEPTATTVPSPTPEPTAEPTATSEPTATPPPAAGTVLYEADTSGGFEDWSNAGGWQTVSGMLVNDGSSEDAIFTAAPYEPPMADYAIEVDMQWVRGGDTFGILARAGDDGSGYWSGAWPGCNADYDFVWTAPPDDSCDMWLIHGRSQSIAFAKRELDSEWHTYRIEVQGNAIRVLLDGTPVIETTDNSSLAPGKVGLWSAGAQVSIRRFTVIALGEAGEGGQSADSPSTAVVSGSDSDSPSVDGSGTDVSSLLPAVADVPGGLVETGRRTRTLPDVADNYTDAAETTQRFTEWGWQENAVASFALPPGQEARSGEVNGVYVSIHRFSRADAARAALDFSLTEQAAGTSLQEVNARPLGEHTRALYGPTDGGNEITLLCEQGDLLIRVSVSMPDGDPTAEAESIVQGILAKATPGPVAGSVLDLLAVESGMPGSLGA
jgi:hypothetical protein